MSSAVSVIPNLFGQYGSTFVLPALRAGTFVQRLAAGRAEFGVLGTRSVGWRCSRILDPSHFDDLPDEVPRRLGRLFPIIQSAVIGQKMMVNA